MYIAVVHMQRACGVGMDKIERKYVDWTKTGKNLYLLRNDNLNLRRYVCFVLNLHKGNCDGDCINCRYEMDNSISRKELADVLGTSDSVIANWEKGKTPVGIEDLLLYCDICGIGLNDILVFE